MKKLYFYLLLPLSVCHANPQDPVVIAGEAGFTTNSTTQLTITASDKAIIHWKDFSIGAGETTSFVQPSSNSIVLNRVTGAIPSNIFGTLEATGKVFLINPQGILIGESGAINVGAFVASTLDILDHDFMQRRDLLFKGSSPEFIINLGTITAWDGDVIILARSVDNSGMISSPRGSTLLGAGHEIWLKPTGHEKLFIRPKTDGTSEGSISASGEISALQVELKADGNPYTYAINHSGNIDALSVTEKQGKVFLIADGSKIKHTGTISTDGSEVTISAAQITLGSGEKKGKGNLLVQSDLPATLSVKAEDDLLLNEGFSMILQRGALDLKSERGDVALHGSVKLGDGHLYIQAAQDIKIGSGTQGLHSRIDAAEGSMTLTAGRDLLLTASDTRVAQINSSGNITLMAGRDAVFLGGKESAARAFVFSKNNLSLVSGRHLSLNSTGSGYAGIGATKDVTVVVDNDFPVPPQVGPGGVLMGPNTRMQGGTLRLFTAKQSNNIIEGVLNLVSYYPGAEYISTSEESWGTYFYSFSGGVPFTIFYKDVWVSSRVTDLFNTATYEFLQNLKYFDDFYYTKKVFWERYNKQGYEKLEPSDSLSSPEILPDKSYRMLEKRFINCNGNLGELL
ncbi:MAG: filamentous hemagglutinin N-terminal domain-containing protein [Chlamydiales bacterium]|nr:filamentous hemagglutinin N-terminal domain-containing protein [Chlamydiales bacterium]